MRLTRDQFLALVRATWERDNDRVHALALQVAAGDGPATESVKRILGKERRPTMVPLDLQTMVRETTPWTTCADLVVADDTTGLVRRVAAEHQAAETLLARGLRPISRLLFHGPSGTGKTSVASAVAVELDRPLFVVPMDAIVGSYLGQSSERLRKVFDYVRGVPCVVLLDEIDAIGKSRERGDDMGEQGRILTTLLVILDELRLVHSPAIVIATTNLHGAIDSALARRFDVEHAFDLSSVADAQAIANRVFQKAQVASLPVPWAERRSAAFAESWALTEAKRAVIEELGIR